jgi:glutamine kinase
MMQLPNKGRLFLLTGLSGAGKSTLGKLLTDHLNHFGIRPAFLLDGDSVRGFFDSDLSFTADDRDAVTRRMAYSAFTLTENGIDVVMANIAGSRATRQFLRRRFTDYIEIHMNTDLATVMAHDVKGIYKKWANLEQPQIVGMDIPYEEPVHPDVVISPYKETPEEGLRKILDFLANRGPLMGTKADTLASVGLFLKKSHVLPQVVLSWDKISRDPFNQLKKIASELGSGPYILRSSCHNEDSKKTSNAGAFESVPNVPADTKAFYEAAKRVRDSYAKKGVEEPDQEQILIQPMLTDVTISGVVCSRYKCSDSPYYVVNYDSSSSTDTVTGGYGGKTVFVSRFIKNEDLREWTTLVETVRELESLFPRFPLEIEFAVTRPLGVVILQCRPLLVDTAHVSLEESAAELIEELKLRFDRLQAPQPHLPGGSTVLSDMADWNPSEIIGDKPSTLSYSIYRELVTDKTWHEARTSQGYFNVVQANLMLSMARKPYIDVRMSFASFTPASLSEQTREELVNFYLQRLKDNPQFHDKVEFEILYTCHDLAVEDRVRAHGGLGDREINELLESLRQLTNRLVLSAEDDIAADFEKLNQLDLHLEAVRTAYLDKNQYWDCFNMAYLLFEHTRVLGVLPFARLARLAFIARSLLFSLQKKGLVADEFCQQFLSHIPTVATHFTEDLERFQKKRLSRTAFLRKYGHLRMSTYDISSARYDSLPGDLWSLSRRNREKRNGKHDPELDAARIDQALIDVGLEFDSRTLLNFIRIAIQAREQSKFRFSRPLSEAIECLAKGGELLGVSRDDLHYTTLQTLLRFRNPEFGSPAKTSAYLRQRIDEKVKERSAFDLIKLPPVISNKKDIELVELSAARPNFISNQCITAPVVRLSNHVDPASLDLTGKVVVIENADPGYDWIFTFPIKGLITKYGGVASHMAIRCSEFDLPGAIGCGELIFSLVEAASSVRLDCKSEAVYAL